MTKITVLGAGGRIARHAIAALLEEPANELTLYLRRPGSLADVPADRVQVIEGDVLDEDLLTRTVTGQDIVYANLGGGDIEAQARAVLERELGDVDLGLAEDLDVVLDDRVRVQLRKRLVDGFLDDWWRSGHG